MPQWHSSIGDMETWHFVYLLTIIVGLVPAGLAGSGWAMATGQTPHMEILYRHDQFTPLKLAALVLYAPLAVVRAGISYFEYNPILALVFLAIGLGWSFLQGVFIMTTFFGFT